MFGETAMRIKKILNQHRRDFTAVYECEHCGDKETKSGYDDAHFHNNVIPDMECRKCGCKAGDAYRPLASKHPEGQQL